MVQNLQCRDGLKKGIDPFEQRRLIRNEYLFEELAEKYITEYAKPHKRTWHADLRRLEIHVLPKWAKKRVSEIRRKDVAELHKQIGVTTKYEANRTIEVLQKMFNLASLWEFIEDNAANPAKGIPAFKELKRDRYIQKIEMSRFADAIAQEDNIYVRHIFWLYLLTGFRRSELLNLKWSDIDWGRKEIRLGRTKADRPHYLPMSDQIIQFLEKTPIVEGNPYIFVGAVEGQALVNIDKPWIRIKQRAGLLDCKIHDIRRTCGSWLAQDGFSLHLIGKVLNQTSQTVTAVYAHFHNDDIREALERHGDILSNYINPQPPPPVQPALAEIS